jgi:chromate transporter
VPPAILFFGLTRLWRWHAFSRWRDRLARGLAPVSVGLVFAGTWSVLTTEGGGVLGWIVTGASLLALLLSEVHPFVLLGGGALIFLCRSLLA